LPNEGDVAPAMGEELTDMTTVDLASEVDDQAYENNDHQLETFDEADLKTSADSTDDQNATTDLATEMNDPEDNDGDETHLDNEGSSQTTNLDEPFQDSEVVEHSETEVPQEEVGENDEDDQVADEVNNSTDQPAEGPTTSEADQEADQEITTMEQDSIADNDQNSNLNEPFQETEVVEESETETPQEEVGENDEDDQVADEVNNSDFDPAEGAPLDNQSTLDVIEDATPETAPVPEKSAQPAVESTETPAASTDEKTDTSNLNEPFQDSEVVEHSEAETPQEEVGENDEDDQIADEVNNSSDQPAEGAPEVSSDLSNAMNNVDATGPVNDVDEKMLSDENSSEISQTNANSQEYNQQDELIEQPVADAKADNAETFSTQAEENINPEEEDALTDAFVRAALGPDVDLDESEKTEKSDHESFDGQATEIDLTADKQTPAESEASADLESTGEDDQVHQISEKELDDIVDAITIKITEEITISSGTNEDGEPDVTKFVTMNINDVELGEEVLYNDEVYTIIGAENNDGEVILKLEPKDRENTENIEVPANQVREIN